VVDEVYRFYTVPASNTAVGHIILENRIKGGKKSPTRPAKKSAPKLKRAAALQRRDVVRGQQRKR
jgi:protocatechuate 4,5-dioxygenase beta chain